MPLIRTTGLKNFALKVDDDPFYFRLNVEIRRRARQPIDNDLQRPCADSGRYRRACVFWLKHRRRFSELRLLIAFFFLERFYIVEGHFESKLKLRFKRGRVILSKCSSLEQLPFV